MLPAHILTVDVVGGRWIFRDTAAAAAIGDGSPLPPPLRHFSIEIDSHTTQLGMSSLLRPRGASVVELKVHFTKYEEGEGGVRSPWVGLLEWLDAPWTRSTLQRLTLRLSYPTVPPNLPLQPVNFAELAWRLASLPLLQQFHLHVSPGLTMIPMGWGEVYALLCCTKGRCASLNATVEEQAVREWLLRTKTTATANTNHNKLERLRLGAIVAKHHDDHGHLPTTKELGHAPTYYITVPVSRCMMASLPTPIGNDRGNHCYGQSIEKWQYISGSTTTHNDGFL